MPLIANGFSALSGLDDDAPIAPGAHCLSDVTSGRGYTNVYIAGTELVGKDASYFGYANFFATHGGGTIIDRSVFLAEGQPGADSLDLAAYWGFRDEVVFDRALKEIERLAAQPAPFLVSIATMDTHGPDAFLSRSCRGPDQPEMVPDMGLAVGCVAKLAEAFVETLRAQVSHRDLRIIVLSDHLAHRSNSYERLRELPRLNTVLFLTPGEGARVIEKQGTMVDVYPTLLDWLGWLPVEAEGVGLGRSLFGSEPTLAEARGLDLLNRAILADVEFSTFLWTGGGD